MSSEDFEIAEYFRGLLDHEAGCEAVECPSCAALRRILASVRERFFLSAVHAIQGSPAHRGQNSPEPVKTRTTRRRLHTVR